jgi:hypothetical protein
MPVGSEGNDASLSCTEEKRKRVSIINGERKYFLSHEHIKMGITLS